MRIPQERSTVPFIALGDIMLGGRVASAIEKAGARQLLDGMRGYTEPSALIFGNLEMPFSNSNEPYLGGVHPSYRVPPSCVQAVEALRLKVVNLATNHVLDWGPEAIELTLTLLSERGIETVGAGRNEREARKPAIIRTKDLRAGFLGYCKKGEYSSTGNTPGSALLDPQEIVKDIVALREEVDILVVSLHWGLELSDHPYPQDIKIAHRLMDAGADIILGHHPHVIQGIEERNGGLIAYSLGNFIFDNRAGHIVSQQSWDKRHQGIFLRARLGKNHVFDYDIVPTQITEDLHVVPAQGEVKEEILDRIKELSKIIAQNQAGDFFYREGVEGILRRELRTYWVLLHKEGLSCLLRGFRNFKWRYVKLISRFLWSKVVNARR